MARAVVPVLALLLLSPACAANGMDPGDLECDGKCDGASREGSLRDNLLHNLRDVMRSGQVLFGQERFPIIGVDGSGRTWTTPDGALTRSDASTITGRHPAVLGMDAWDLAFKPDSWGPTPAAHARAAHETFAQGGVVTIEWHMRGCDSDPLDATGFYASWTSLSGNRACLCRVANDDDFARRWLIEQQVARFADALVRYGLHRIPIIFRPFHEFTGSWFWWGYPFWDCQGSIESPRFTGPEAFKRVFRMVVDYLRRERGLENLIIAYAPDRLALGVTSDTIFDDAGDDEDVYLAGYPGDEYVDIFGIDLYYRSWGSFEAQRDRFARYLEVVTRLAEEHGKIAALTETGNYAGGSASQGFTEALLPLLRDNPRIRLAYALTWENRSTATNELYVPYASHRGVDDFRAFESSDTTLFLGDDTWLYSAAPDGTPICEMCTSDPDGDGWGYELDTSCLTPPRCHVTPSLPAATGSVAHDYPTCQGCTDPEGDRWGWESSRSCVIPVDCVARSFPACASCTSDPDRDGWGWENLRSCRVPTFCSR